MARRKSSLDLNEPVVVQGEEIIDETAAEPIMEPEAEKADESAVMENKKKMKAETQNKKVDTKERKGVKICVI